MTKLMLVLSLLVVGVSTTALAQKNPAQAPAKKQVPMMKMTVPFEGFGIEIIVPQRGFQPQIPGQIEPTLNKILNRLGCLATYQLSRFEKFHLMVGFLQRGMLKAEELQEMEDLLRKHKDKLPPLRACLRSFNSAVIEGTGTPLRSLPCERTTRVILAAPSLR